MKLSVGILSYKRTDLLIETIQCLNCSHDIELVLLNNNDFCIINEIKDIIPSNISLVYLWDGINYGVSIGRNKLIENTKSDIMIILDDDVYINNFEKIVNSVIDEFTLDSSVGALAFNIKEYKSKSNNKYEIPHKNKKIDMNKDFYTYLIIGAGNAVNVKLVRDVGNFPKDFGLYGFEEIDLAFRIINSGNKIKYKSDCVVYHKKSPDGRFSNNDINYLYFVNRTKMAKSYLGGLYYFSCFIVRSGHFLFKTKNIKLYIKAVGDIVSYNKKNKFDNKFFTYVKSVNGFIWY